MTASKQYQKSLLNAYSNTQVVGVDSNVIFNQINILNGSSIDFNAGTSVVTLAKPGVYLITIDANISDVDAAGVVTLQINKNGVQIPGAIVNTTAAIDTNYSVNMTTIVKVLPSCCAIDNSANITIVNTGIETTYSNVNISIVKLC